MFKLCKIMGTSEHLGESFTMLTVVTEHDTLLKTLNGDI